MSLKQPKFTQSDKYEAFIVALLFFFFWIDTYMI